MPFKLSLKCCVCVLSLKLKSLWRGVKKQQFVGRYYIFTSEESSRQAGPIGHSTRTLEPRVSYVCNLGTSGREREKQAADPGTISLKKTKEE